MKQFVAGIALASAAFVTMACVVPPAEPVLLPSITLPACETEDSTEDCYWDASERGNGQGSDFIVFHGEVLQ